MGPYLLRWQREVAHIVANAAAKHLTVCLLELGGKSSIVVDTTYDMELTAKHIAYPAGKV
ncbi:hypothetical protein EDC04DRAFT_967706 [Pisolithus marmoratus]|nr:hypothetical protein EDC04DRAFT_967706 [Pisolithus marmoratus]